MFVLGVYPSAIHVRWDLPAWARDEFGVAVGALAVADEPTVFWDGNDADALVDLWRRRVGFRSGDGPDQWGQVRAVGNGTSGRPVRDGILRYLSDGDGVSVDETWFTDAVNEFFVKRGGPGSRQQGDVHDRVYGPFARRLSLPEANLPTRPSPNALVERAVTGHRDRLRGEFSTASAPIVVTLGEEARRVLERVADSVAGTPTLPLDRTIKGDVYGVPGSVTIGDFTAQWFALIHPGNRDKRWTRMHQGWQQRMRPDLTPRPA